MALLVSSASVARAQEAERAAAERVHVEGGYPDDITVFEDTTDATTLEDGDDASDGAGSGPNGSISPHGERDGGSASRTLDIPMPDFLRDLLSALGGLLASAGLQYLCLAVGLVLLAIFVTYLVTLFRFPRRELAVRRGHRVDATGDAIDPFLAESPEEPEEYARQGRYREAIHAVFVRALGRAASSGDVDRRGRTAREVVLAITRLANDSSARSTSALAPLDELLSLTELVWFGGRPATAEQYAQATSLATRLAGTAPAKRDAAPSPEPS